MNDSLTKFANTLYAEAIEEKTKIQKRLDSEMADTLAECEEDLEKRFKRELRKFRSESENEKRLILSKREVELMTQLRKIRQTAAENVMENVEKKLIAFANGEQYGDYLKREAVIAEMFTSGKTVCYARECDYAQLKDILKIDKLEFEKTTDNIIGGFMLKNTELGLMADCTLKNKLEENKELFLEISGLVID